MGNLPSYSLSKPTVIAPWVNYLRRSVALDGNRSSTARLDGSESNPRLALSSISLSRDTTEQWIIQKRSAEPLHQGVWRSVSYVVSRDKLIELSASLGLLSEPSKRAVLERWPSSATDLRK